METICLSKRLKTSWLLEEVSKVWQSPIPMFEAIAKPGQGSVSPLPTRKEGQGGDLLETGEADTGNGASVLDLGKWQRPHNALPDTVLGHSRSTPAAVSYESTASELSSRTSRA